MRKTPEERRRKDERHGFVRVVFFCEDENIAPLIWEYSNVEHVKTRVIELVSMSELSRVEESLGGVVIVDITENCDSESLLGLSARRALSDCEVIVLCSHHEAEYWQEMVLRQEISDFHVVRPLTDPWGLKIKIWRAVEWSAGMSEGANTLAIPVSPTPENSDAAQEQRRKLVFFGNCALIIEDDIPSAEVAEGILVSEGFEVRCAKSVVDAYARFVEEVFDVVLLDLMLPGISGPAAVKAVREKLNCKEVPIIVTTAYSEKSLVRRCFQEGANEYLLKPISRKKLLPRMASVLGVSLDCDW